MEISVGRSSLNPLDSALTSSYNKQAMVRSSEKKTQFSAVVERGGEIDLRYHAAVGYLIALSAL